MEIDAHITNTPLTQEYKPNVNIYLFGITA